MSTNQYITLDQAATLRGGSVAGLRRWLDRLARTRPDLRVRRLYGRVHAQDLANVLEALAKERERNRRQRALQTTNAASSATQGPQ